MRRAAKCVPYYRRRWGERWRAVKSRAELPRLPFLTKEEACRHQRSLLASRMEAFAGVVSSGTQHGDRRPLRVPVTPDELRAAARWAPRAPSRRGPLLEVLSMQHGLPDAPPPPGVLRIPWTFTANAFRLFRELVSRPQAGGWITALLIGAGAIVPLTLHLLENGVSPARTRVRSVGTTGFRLGSRWRGFLADAWEADVYDNFSLSEFATPALECADCGFHHWTWPPVVAEVVDVFSKRPLSRGTGALVMTGLHPFVQAMPLVRYWTGDLVELGPRCRRAKEQGFRFRGRIGQAVLRRGMPGEPLLVSAADVEEFLDGRPEVARLPHPCARLGLVRSAEAGVVKFEVENRREGPMVRVELRFDPRIHPSAAEAVGHGLAKRLLSRSPRLAALEGSREGELEIRLLPPGALQRRWSKF
ncbi:MAG: hypothetical protein HYZ28_14015 [Myxococcales bacterium]|nr:hypothetical protein [Myxococcales bacterium]